MIAFDVEVTSADNRVIVRPVGELDLATADELEAALKGSTDGHRQLIVDLRGLSFMDSVGLDLLLRWARLAGERGVAFRVVRGARPVDRVFDLTNTRSRFDFVDPGIDVDLQVLEGSID
jgi:anti-sigma B factor antagonist